MDSDRGKKGVKKMEQRCHFKIIGSCSRFHYFLWQGASKKIPPIDEYFSTVIESQRARGFRLSLLGNLWASPLDNLEEGWMGKAEGSEAPSKPLGWGTGAGEHTVFSVQILWSFCQTGVYKAKPSREFSYFLGYSPGVHLNRNQLFAFSLLQHVTEENLASGLAIIKNKNILLCWENSTTGNKRTEIICIQDSRDVFQLNVCSPFSPHGFHFKISWCIHHLHCGLLFLKTERQGVLFPFTGITAVVQTLARSCSVIKLNYQRNFFFFNFTTAEMKK